MDIVKKKIIKNSLFVDLKIKRYTYIFLFLLSSVIAVFVVGIYLFELTILDDCNLFKIFDDSLYNELSSGTGKKVAYTQSELGFGDGKKDVKSLKDLKGLKLELPDKIEPENGYGPGGYPFRDDLDDYTVYLRGYAHYKTCSKKEFWRLARAMRACADRIFPWPFNNKFGADMWINHMAKQTNWYSEWYKNAAKAALDKVKRREMEKFKYGEMTDEQKPSFERTASYYIMGQVCKRVNRLMYTWNIWK